MDEKEEVSAQGFRGAMYEVSVVDQGVEGRGGGLEATSRRLDKDLKGLWRGLGRGEEKPGLSKRMVPVSCSTYLAQVAPCRVGFVPTGSATKGFRFCLLHVPSSLPRLGLARGTCSLLLMKAEALFLILCVPQLDQIYCMKSQDFDNKN